MLLFTDRLCPLGFAYGKWYYCFKQAALKAKGQPLDDEETDTPLRAKGQPLDDEETETPLRAKGQPLDDEETDTPLRAKGQPLDDEETDTPLRATGQPLDDEETETHLKECKCNCNITRGVARIFQRGGHTVRVLTRLSCRPPRSVSASDEQ